MEIVILFRKTEKNQKKSMILLTKYAFWIFFISFSSMKNKKPVKENYLQFISCFNAEQ